MKSILPILKSHHELQTQKDNGVYVEELFPALYSPILLFGEDDGESVVYNQSQGEEADLAMKTEALKNLKKIKVELDVQELKGFKIIICQHEYAAEKILDKDFLEHIGQVLETYSLVVGIPNKGFFAAIAKGKGEAKLYNAVVNQYNNAPTYPIADTLFYIIKGEISMVGAANAHAAEETNESYLEVTGRNNEKGKIVFNAKVGHITEEGLFYNIQKAFQHMIIYGIKDTVNFSGKINFYIHPDYNDLTATLRNRITNITMGMSEKGAAQLMGVISDEGFKVSFFYGEEQLIAETIEPENNVPKPNDENTSIHQNKTGKSVDGKGDRNKKH